jgi:hypothetical protein
MRKLLCCCRCDSVRESKLGVDLAVITGTGAKVWAQNSYGMKCPVQDETGGPSLFRLTYQGTDLLERVQRESLLPIPRVCDPQCRDQQRCSCG